MLARWVTREWARKGEERARGIMKEIVSVEVSAFSATVGSLAVRQLNDDLFVTSSCPGYEKVSSLARKERETTVTQKLKKIIVFAMLAPPIHPLFLETTEVSSNIRSLRIASSVLSSVVVALYARQGPHLPPLSLSVPPGRRQPLLLSRESGVHHSPPAPKDLTPSSLAEDPVTKRFRASLNHKKCRSKNFIKLNSQR